MVTRTCNCCGSFQETASCFACFFSLCALCSFLKRDRGRSPFEDPYEALAALAKEVGTSLASAVVDVDPRIDGSAGTMILIWRVYWEDVIPPNDVCGVSQNRDGGLYYPRVLPKGTSVTVRLAPDILSLLEDMTSMAEVETPVTSPGPIYAELHFPDGATAEHLVPMRNSFRYSSVGVAIRACLLGLEDMPNDDDSLLC
jgi:hypothetical protein